MKPEAWFCPACQKHHAPHVDTCPSGAGGTKTKGVPQIRYEMRSAPPLDWSEIQRAKSYDIVRLT